MKLLGTGYIFNAEEAQEELRTACFTSACRLASGKILTFFRIGSMKDSADGNCWIAESSDNGGSWEIICRGFDRTHDGLEGEIRGVEILEPANGTLTAILGWYDRSKGERLYNGEADRTLPSRLRKTVSTDGGRTWHDYEALNTGILTEPAITGNALHLKGIGYLIPFEDYEPREPGGTSLHSAHALYSPDGTTFPRVIQIARHPGDEILYWDQRLSVCPKTSLPVAMFWTYNRKTEKDIDIHISWGDSDTFAWEEPVSTGIRGQITAPIPVEDGRLFAFYVHRHPPGSMRLICSEDRGKTWNHEEELVIYESRTGKERGGDGESDYARYWDDMGTWSFGHPAGIVLDEKRLLLVYYAGEHHTRLSVRWAVVAV